MFSYSLMDKSKDFKKILVSHFGKLVKKSENEVVRILAIHDQDIKGSQFLEQLEEYVKKENPSKE